MHQCPTLSTTIRASLLSALALALVACVGTVPGGDDGFGGGKGGGGDDEFGAGADGGSGAPSCDEVRPIELSEAQPPDLLLVVDKSGSMADALGGQQKWATMRGALNNVVTSNGNSIRFGLMLYPANDVCAQGSVSAPISGGNGSAISAALSQVNPEGGTPTHTSLQEALSYYQGAPVNPNGRYVLLATDGEPNCANTNDPTIPTVNESLTALVNLYNTGISTYVLGFGNGNNPDTLQSMAQAGGTGQYFAANSPAELQAALDAIAGEVALPDCSFALGETPSDPTRLRLFFDDAEVARSAQHTDGWDYDAATNTLSIYGPSCDTLQSGSVQNVKVDYGCEGAVID